MFHFVNLTNPDVHGCVFVRVVAVGEKCGILAKSMSDKM